MRWSNEVFSRVSPGVRCGGFFNEADLKPHQIRYWLAEVADEERDEKIADICAVYEQAPARYKEGERTISTDEMTGVQALERMHDGMPMRAGKRECREFDYIRHGTLTFILNFDVATGEIPSPSFGATRGNEDFARHIQRTIETDPAAKRWHFVLDNLNIHRSEALVRYVASVSGVDEDLGIAGKYGILKSKVSRTLFLSNPEHKVVFHYTPRHCSWLNQIEIWLGILARKVLRRGNFISKEDLCEKVLAFIDYFNHTMAKPFRWTYRGKPLLC